MLEKKYYEDPQRDPKLPEYRDVGYELAVLVHSLRKSWTVVKRYPDDSVLISTPNGYYRLEESPNGDIVRLTAVLHYGERESTEW